MLVDVLKSCWASAVLNISTCLTTGRQVEKLTPVLKKTGSRMRVFTVCFGACERTPGRAGSRVKNISERLKATYRGGGLLAYCKVFRIR